MKNKTVILSILGVVGLIIVVFVAPKPNQPTSQNNSAYCSSEGTLTDTMPIQSHRSYCLKSDSEGKVYAVNAPNTYSFSIIDDQGNILRDFEITHTKPMHVIVVRKDLANFQHVHPNFDEASGSFSFTDLTFPADGEYRIFADFAPQGGMKDPEGMPLPVTLSQDVNVGNVSAYRPQPLGGEERTKTFDANQVILTTMPQNLMAGMESMLTFSLSRDGKAITDLEEYLGALGHSVVLRGGTLDFIHAHPMDNNVANQNGKVEFMVSLPQEGKYKVFTQFQKNGKVVTTDFIISVQKSSEPMDESMPGMQH